MLVLVTGVPGAGKTLYALSWVKTTSEREKRPVYYSGIEDLRLPWTEIDPTKWADCPKGSIIVIDEAQRVLRPRMHGSSVPEYVAALETHRKLGIDIVLITQHPMLIDSNARRLVGLHFHVVRKFGTQAATVHEWASVKDNADKNREGSTRHDFLYPREAYGFYKSAEVHTHKARIPMRVWLLALVPLVIAASGYVAYTYFSAWGKPSVASAPPSLGSSSSVLPARGAASSSNVPRPREGLSLEAYVEHFSPRVAGLEHTAPAFDELTRPRVVPYPAACVSSGSRCKCYTDQATVLAVGLDLCRQLVERGFFVAWRDPGRASEQSASGLAAGGGGSSHPQGGVQGPPQHVLFGASTPGVLPVAPSDPAPSGRAPPRKAREL